MELARAEAQRLWRRWDLWLVLAVPLLFTAATYALGLVSAESSLEGTRAMSGGGRDLSHRLDPFAFPASVPGALHNAEILCIGLLAYFVVATIHAEYAYGTLKTSLVMRHARRAFVVVRLGAVGMVGIAVAASVALLGALLPLAPLAIGVDLPSVGMSPYTIASGIGGLALLAILVVCIAGFETFVVRSAGLPLVLIGAQVAIESALLSAAGQLPGPVAFAVALLPLNSARLVADQALAGSGGYAAPPTALLVTAAALWIVAFAVLAAETLQRADVE